MKDINGNVIDFKSLRVRYALKTQESTEESASAYGPVEWSLAKSFSCGIGGLHREIGSCIIGASMTIGIEYHNIWIDQLVDMLKYQNPDQPGETIYLKDRLNCKMQFPKGVAPNESGIYVGFLSGLWASKKMVDHFDKYVYEAMVEDSRSGRMLPLSDGEWEAAMRGVEDSYHQNFLWDIYQMVTEVLNEYKRERIVQPYIRLEPHKHGNAYILNWLLSDGVYYNISVIFYKTHRELAEYLGMAYSLDHMDPPNPYAPFDVSGLCEIRPLPPGALELAVKRFMEDVGGNRDEVVQRKEGEPLNLKHLLNWLYLRNISVPKAYVDKLLEQEAAGTYTPEGAHVLAGRLSWDEDDHSKFRDGGTGNLDN